MEQTQTIGKRISALRKKAGLTQDALARNLGVSPQAVSKWENDLSCPDISLLPKLSRILGVTTDTLLGVEEDAEESESAPAEEFPEPESPVIHVESQNGTQFDVHFDPPRGAGVAFALWIILTGILMLGPVAGLESIGFWMAALISGALVFSIRSMCRRVHFFNFAIFLCSIFTALSSLSVIGVDLAWDLMWPGMILLFGLFLLAEQFRKKNRRSRRSFRFSGPDSAFSDNTWMEDGRLYYSNSFREDKYYVSTPLLTGGEIHVSFGDHVLDFSGVGSLAENCALEVNSAFGEVCLKIPSRYRAELRANKSFATAEFHGAPDADPEGILYIDANLSFGELEIRYI